MMTTRSDQMGKCGSLAKRMFLLCLFRPYICEFLAVQAPEMEVKTLCVGCGTRGRDHVPLHTATKLVWALN